MSDERSTQPADNPQPSPAGAPSQPPVESPQALGAPPAPVANPLISAPTPGERVALGYGPPDSPSRDRK